MIALKKGQGAALTVVPEPPTRTPERQALADAIEAREFVATLVEERRELAEQINRSTYPHYDRLRELEELERGLPRDERDRLNLLLSRRDPDARTEREKIAAERAEIDEKLTVIRAEHRRAEADNDLLAENLKIREYDVRDCIKKVIRADPAQAAVSDELRRLNARRFFLGRAAEGALNVYEPGAPDRFNASLGRLVQSGEPPGPCPWREAMERLNDDPDAVLPMPQDV